MGKAIKETQGAAKKTVKELEKEIKKQKTLRANLKQFVEKLHRSYPGITTREYSTSIHNFIKNFKNVNLKKAGNINKATYDYVRVCRGCRDWGNRKELIECQQCQDYFHTGCVNTQIEDPKYWMCFTCTELAESRVSRDSQLDRYYSSKPVVKTCSGCKDAIDCQSPITSCIRCDLRYHNHCFQKENASPGVCSNCDQIIRGQLLHKKPLLQKTLYAYFQVQQKQEVSFDDKFQPDTQLEQQTVSYEKLLYLKPPIKLTDKEIQYYKEKLLYAIYSKKMSYSQDLVFQVQLHVEESCSDPTLASINKKDQNAYRKYKSQPIGPYRIQLVLDMGYDVKADRIIPKGTIICEYIGQVISKRDALNFLDNDSLMDLSFGSDADSSLIIKPQKYTNMGRFINGVNNSDPNREKKINVKSVRMVVCGKPIVLLFASRKIEKNESLIYDYNAGGLDMYETHQFV